MNAFLNVVAFGGAGLILWLLVANHYDTTTASKPLTYEEPTEYTGVPSVVVKDGNCEIKRFYDQYHFHYYPICNGQIMGVTDAK